MSGLGGGVDDDEIAEAFEQILDEAPGILTGFDHSLHGAIDACSVTGGERVDDIGQQRIRSVAQKRDGPTVVDAVGSGTGDELVEHGQGVAHGSAPGTHDQRQHSLVHLHTLTAAQVVEIVAQCLRRHQPEGIVMRPRADRADDLLRLGRGEDELDVRRRLLDDLEQSVEAL